MGLVKEYRESRRKNGGVMQGRGRNKVRKGYGVR